MSVEKWLLIMNSEFIILFWEMYCILGWNGLSSKDLDVATDVEVLMGRSTAGSKSLMLLVNTVGCLRSLTRQQDEHSGC